MTRILRVFLLSLVLCFTVSSFVFAASSSVSVVVPYCEPSTGTTTGYLTVYTDEGRTYTYTWSFYGATDSIAFTQGGLTLGVVDGGDKLLIRLVEMDATNTVYGTLVCYGGGGVDIIKSGLVSVAEGYTVNPTGNITHYYLSGYVGSVSTDFDNFGRLDITWGNDSELYSKVDTIVSRLGTISSRISLTNDKLDLLYTLASNNYEDFKSIFESYMFQLTKDSGDTVNRLSSIVKLLEEWADSQLNESTNSLPSDDISNLENSQGSIRDESNVSDDIGTITNSFDFSDYGQAFDVVWTLCVSILLTNTTLYSLLFLVLSLGVVNLILSRR